jgi:ribokinase
VIRPRRLIGLASILLDLSVDVPALPPRGGDVLGREAGFAPGGGINALTAARRLGLGAVYAGPHGTGRNGDAVRAALRRDDVDALLAPDPRGDTGYCLALLEPDGERTFITVPGVEARATPAGLATLEVGAGDAVYASGYDLAYPESGPALGDWLPALPRADAAGPWLVLDPGPLAADIPAARLAAVLARTDLLSVSAIELLPLGGRDAVLAALPPAASLLLRDGPRGARLLLAATGGRRPEELHAPAAPPPGPVADGNGAGDVHLGALLAGLGTGSSWWSALELAARAAAWSLTRWGAASGPDREQLARAHPGRDG